MRAFVISCDLRPCLAQEPPKPQWPLWPPWQGLVKPAPNLYCFPTKKLQDYCKKTTVRAQTGAIKFYEKKDSSGKTEQEKEGAR